MVFSSLLFLFIFLPLFLLAYFLVPRKLRNLILVVFSLMFYAWGEPRYVFIMIFSTLLDYTCGRLIDRYKSHKLIPNLVLMTSVTINLSMLGLFKYADFLIGSLNSFLASPINLLNLTLPIGISFYTFQTMSYTIDLYRGKIAVQKNLIAFAAYVTMFPQLIAGPIVTYSNVEKEMNTRHVTMEGFGNGAIRFIEGLGKKVLLANNIGLLWDHISKITFDELSMIGAWLGVVAFALQLYFDFSGYSDMAIGLGQMMGFHFPENFNYPYLSKSISEFWRRWHMTLGGWFREYVYIPLGGNRVSKPKLIRNLLIVWFLTGFWHGAGWNFVVWGLYFGILIILERSFLLDFFKSLPTFVSRIYVFIALMISWVFFSQDSLGHALDYLGVMFSLKDHPLITTQTAYLFNNYFVTLVIGFLFATPLMKKIRERMPSWTLYLYYVAILVISTAYLVDATFNPFLYFRF